MGLWARHMRPGQGIDRAREALVISYRYGGGAQNSRNGQVKSYPYKAEAGSQNIKSFGIVLKWVLEALATLKGRGHKRIPPIQRG